MLVLESGDKLRGDASAAAVVDYTIHGIIGSIPTQFADGQLAAIIGDLYTSAGIVIVASITLVNTDSVARTVNLYLTPSGGTARRLIAKDLSLAAGYSLMFDGNKFEVIDTFGQIATTRTSALIGPAASTANAVVRFSGTTGKLAKDSTAVVIDDSNNVGIGTVSPTTKLYLRDATSLAVTIDHTSSSGYGSLLFSENGASPVGFIQHIGSASVLTGREDDLEIGTSTPTSDVTFRPNNTERVRMTAGGNVGIGAASPGALLDVQGNPGQVLVNLKNTGTHTELRIDSSAANRVSNLTFYNNNVNKWSISSRGTIDATNDRLSFYNTGGEAMSILQSGNVGIGTADPKTPFQTHFAADINLMFTSDATHAIISAANDANNANIPFALYGTTILLSGVTTISAATFLTGLGAASAGTTMVLVAGTNEVRPLLSSKEFKDEITVAKTPGITDLTVKQFKWKESQELDYGLIAEEAAEVCPVIVNFYEGKPISIKWATLTALLLEKVQTLEKRIEQLEKK